jgi:UDP-glucose:(glucosyl)LPS alpha-1,2-glucosyltransferase
MDEVQIFPSRVRVELDPTKIRILYCQDLADDPEASHLDNDGWRRFHKFVFVSHHQQQAFIERYQIPHSRCSVLQNAITPIPVHTKPKDRVNLIYTSTPHRGLNILYAAFCELAKKRQDVHLDVFSSFKIYGWGERDQAFEQLFDMLREHPQITYHGSVPNEQVREALQRAHVFAYPSTWIETSCIALIEAMSADLVCVHSNLGALYETASMWTMMYPFHESMNDHANIFYHSLQRAVETARARIDQGTDGEAWHGGESAQKRYADLFFDWDLRAEQWSGLIRSLLHLDRSIETSESFVYKID